MTHIASFALTVAFATLASSAALAANAECAKVRNVASCNCAVENGGSVKVEGGRTVWYPPAGSGKRQTPGYAAYLACVARSK